MATLTHEGTHGTAAGIVLQDEFFVNIGHCDVFITVHHRIFGTVLRKTLEKRKRD